MAERVVTRGGALLRKWRKAKDLFQVDVCAMLPRHDQARYCAFERGRAKPTLEMAVAIERVTGGAVPCASWFEDDVAAPAVKRRKKAA